MRSHLISLALIFLCGASAAAQGFYQNTARRNPITGELETLRDSTIYPPGNVVGRDQRAFYGSRFTPYTGTEVQSRVWRNPITGRLSVENQYYNPWTGARMETATRFNPFTQRYETVQLLRPPHRPPTEAPERSEELSDEDQQDRRRTGPRIIETKPPDPFPPPPPENGAPNQ